MRYHFVDQWRVGTIATQLGIHHSVVDRVLSQAGMPKIERSPRASIVDPYLPFIIETLETFPTLTAARLYDMVKQRSYPGGPSLFRQRINQLRPRKQPEAYLRLKTLPGEQAQIDWGHFGHLQIGKAKRPLMAFVMVLSWSRKIFLRFYLNTQIELNVQADEWCQGVSANRRCPQNQELLVKEAFLQEQPRLTTLPDNLFDTRERQIVRAKKTPYIRFDLNDYSIPHQQVQKTLHVDADLQQVRILAGDDLIAQHTRSFAKGESN